LTLLLVGAGVGLLVLSPQAEKAWAFSKPGLSLPIDPNNSKMQSQAVETVACTPTPVQGCLAWRLVDSPSPGQYDNSLVDVEVVSANDVWAVGTKGSVDRNTEPMSIHWDGSIWTEIPTPSLSSSYDYVTGVSVISTNDVWMSGFYYNSALRLNSPLLLHWDG